jgi:hypothetical protein
MGVITNLRNAAIAVNVLEGARDACVNLKPMAMYMTDTELQQRAEVVARRSWRLARMRTRCDRS